MTINAPRIAPGGLTETEVNRSFQELADSADAAITSLPIAGLVLLSVPSAEIAAGFTFPTTRRIYSVPSATNPGTNNIRVFNTGSTIIAHPLGRRPKRIVVGQQASSILFDLEVTDVTVIDPVLDPNKFIAFRSSATAIFQIAVF